MLLIYIYIYIYIYIIILLLVQSKTLGGPIEKTVATIGPFCNFFNYFFLFINDFLVINSLSLKIKYKLHVSILFTSIPFVFASIFKFIGIDKHHSCSH